MSQERKKLGSIAFKYVHSGFKSQQRAETVKQNFIFMEQVKVRELPLKMTFYKHGNHGCSQEMWQGLRRCLQVLTFWLGNKF